MTTQTHDILAQIIRDDVLANASQMVTDLCNEGSHWAEDIATDAPDYSELPDGYAVRQNDNGRWEWQEIGADGWADDLDTERDAIIAAWEDSGDEPPIIEALQFWLVSDYLADKLEEVSALVSRDVLGFNIWGRTECGQGLEDDADLLKVAQIIRP